MTNELLLLDDFYNNPQQVRDTALASDFCVRGNFPGERTVSYLNDSMKQAIQNILRPLGGEVTCWGENYTGAFQYTTKNDESWVHCDNFNTWAGVCYLTPNAPYSAGTGLFQHKETGLFRRPENASLAEKLNMDGSDLSKWNLTDVVSNKFNRLVIYRGDLYHRSLDYFGESKHDGRLFQTFFLNTEY